MDPGQLEELRTWGERLSRDESNADLRACGRAILLLVDEVEKLGRERASARRAARASRATPVEQPRPPSRWRTLRIRGLRRMAVALAILGALIFATFALGARLAAPEPRRRGPRGRAPDRPGRPPLAQVLGRRRSERPRPRPLEARRQGRHGRGVLHGRPLRSGRRPLPRRRPPPPGQRGRRLPRLAHDEDLALHGRHQGPDDRVRPARRPDPVAATRSRSRARSSPAQP